MYTSGIFPSTNITFDLGSLDLMWRWGYFGDITVTDNTSIHTLDGSTFGGGGGGGVTTLNAGTGITLVPNPIIGVGSIAIDNTVVTLTGAQILTNKTLTAPAINGIVTTTGLTLPAFTAGGDITTDRWLSYDSNTFLGVGVAGAGNLAHTGGAEGTRNTGIGNNALFAITTSYFNTAVGDSALNSLTSGEYNTAVGQLALGSVTTGQFNTAVGMQTLDSNDGSYNTAIGLFAGRENLTGSNNVFIGSQAGRYELGSNKLYIDSSSTATPLIYGDFSTDNLTINGLLDMSNHQINRVVDPTLAQDAATKNYVDNSVPTIVRKTATENVNNSTVFQNDDELFFAIGANEEWVFEAQIIYDATGSAVADIKFSFVAPAGATLYWCPPMKYNKTDDTVGQGQYYASGQSLPCGSATYNIHFSGWILNGATAGNMQFQWAQNSAVAINTQVIKGSYILAYRVN